MKRFFKELWVFMGYAYKGDEDRLIELEADRKGLIFDMNGRTACKTCGSYCGQCGYELLGLTKKDFHRKVS